MFVHHCNRCCVYFKEIQPCSPKYRGIWAICMNKMMFPFQRCNSVSKCSFREFRPFSVIAENHWPYFSLPLSFFLCLFVFLSLSLCSFIYYFFCLIFPCFLVFLVFSCSFFFVLFFLSLSLSLSLSHCLFLYFFF